MKRVRHVSQRRPAALSVLSRKIRRHIDLFVLRCRLFYARHRVGSRIAAGSMALLMVAAIAIEIIQPWVQTDRYSLTRYEDSLLKPAVPSYTSKLKYDSKNQQFTFNDGYTASPGETAGQSSGPKITASFSAANTKAVTVNDPVNDVALTFKPDFDLLPPRQDQNRIIYPLDGHDGAKVYTLKASGVKEDIILNSYGGDDELSFKYDLGLAEGTEARMEKDGSIGVYGVNNALLGNVTTGSEKDAELLQKARKNSAKTNLLFRLPAPVVMDGNRHVSKSAKSRFALEDGKQLTVQTSGLKDAVYPLSIDPTVYVETAAKLMRGNNETNVDFDVDNELIQKSPTTGARINSWTSGLALPNTVWDQGTAVAGGYVYSVGGQQTTKTTYSTAGSNSFSVPTGVTSIIVKAWGAGGGGAAGSGSSGVGGDGGGGGYAEAEITTTPGENLTVEVGTAGAKAAANSNGGNGGGYSAIKRTSTYLVQAGAGGGGGGSIGTGTGGDGGAGGGTSGVAGTAGSGGTAGGGLGNPGTNAAGGTGGAAGSNGVAGAAGAANAGGDAGGSGAACTTAVSSTGGAGGTGAGGKGGNAATCEGGGGGGSGRFGGGGSGSSNNTNRRNGGGGGGSDLVTGTTIAQTAGSGTTPGNDTDADRGTAGSGGTGATTAASATAGNPGAVVIYYYATSASVYWAHFNSSTGAIEATNPGAGACANWCNNSAYDLPSARRGFSLVAYNGYLYALGGLDSSGTRASTVYIAKLGANGEPSLWHPTGGTAAYWYSDTALSSARSYLTAVAYNNRMYVMGGSTSGSPNGVTTSEKADINPNGVLANWTTTGMQALPSARFGHSVQSYNDVLYLIGGNSGGTLQNTVYYSKLNTDGTMNAWTQTSNFSTAGARATMGGSFSTIYGAYIYLAGGCTAISSGNCTTIDDKVWLASINADGSIGPWNQILGLTNQRMGYGLISWQNSLYRLGGCSAPVAGSSSCDAGSALASTDYGNINPDGDASTVATSVGSGTAPCSGGTPTSCNLPSASVGNVLNQAAILNGYLYIMGGCTNDACTTQSTGVTYQAIASDGSLQKPAVCTGGTFTDSYCVSPTNLPVQLAAAATAVFNGRMYLVGGFDTDTNIYYTSVNNDGSIAAWSNVDLTTIGAVDVTYAFSYARANPSSAGTNPGNLFIFGGCTDGTVGCSNYSDDVYKCNINTTGVPGGCTQTGQLQIGTIPGASGTGLGAMAGAVYANYIYLMGGLAPGVTDLTTVRYAKFDNNNNVVTVGSGWVEGTNQTVTGRRRGAGFGYNGYLYVVGGYDGTSGVLADIEFAKINVSDGSWGTFTVSTVTINQRWGLTVPVSNSYAYVVGGCIAGAAPSSCSSRTNTIQTFQVYNNDSGAVASYTAASDDTFAASTDRWGASAAILNGYVYVAGGCTSATDCTTAVTDVQYAPISATDGSLGTWASATNGLTAVRAWGKLVAVGGFLYYIGGHTSTATATQSTVYYVGTFSSGNITAAWSTASGALGDVVTAGVQTAPRSKFGVAVWDSRIYVIGGLDGAGTPAVTSTVYYSPRLPSGGNIAADSWTSSTAINVARYGNASTAYANNLYLFGGNDGTNYLNDGQYASLGYKTGTISQSGTAVTGSGTTFTSSMVGSTLQYADGSTATISAVGGGTSMTVSANKTVAAGTKYVVLDGSVSTWTYTTSVPGNLSQAEAFAANGYMYLVGGRSAAAACAPNTLIAPISANTTIATGNNPTGVGEWYETNVRYAGGRYGAAVAYTGGKAYVMGGGCASPQAGTYNTGTIAQTTNTVTGTGTTWTDNYIGATITYQDASTATVVSVTDATHLISSVSKTVGAGQTYSLASPRHTYAVLKSQPQVAKYSRMIDTDTDVFPNSWLVNGLDNSVGARWQARYRSMHDTSDGAGQQNPNEDCGTSSSMPVMTTWGLETNFGDVNMGDVATYTPKESGGGNINCARYYYFFLSIDASQTFGYPEDVDRGPTITDLSLFFTADPSKRLRHGKTFTGGQLQPLDTPCRQTVDPQCPLP